MSYLITYKKGLHSIFGKYTAQGRSQTFSFGVGTGGASFATRGAINGLCRTFRKRPTERDLILGKPLGGAGKFLGGQWHPLAPP